MVGWHHRLNGREFEQAPGVGDGQEASCSSWGCKESHTIELNCLHCVEVRGEGQGRAWGTSD